MNIQRISTHLLMTHWQVHRAFPESTLAIIEKAIRAAELAHGGQIHFAVEGALHGEKLIQGMSAHDRAIEVFAQLHVWDTEHNNGVLIYLLLADRRVEIVADRGIHARAGDTAWLNISSIMEESFARSCFEEGAILGINGVAKELARHFPVRGATPNELPDRPTLL